MREMRSCQPKPSSSSQAQRKPMPSGQAAGTVAKMRRGKAGRVGLWAGTGAGAGWGVGGVGAECDSGVAHAGRRFGQGEEQKLVEEREYGEGNGSGDGGGLQGDVSAGGCVYRSAEVADGEGKDGGKS